MDLIQTKIDIMKEMISDIQETIRFIETKTSFVIIFLGGIAYYFFENIEKIKDINGFLVIFLIFSFFLNCFQILSIILPKKDVKKNIIYDENDIPFNFYISKNKYKCKFSYLGENDDFESYLVKFEKLTEKDLVRSLTFEIHKLSFIRNVKRDKFYVLILTSIITILLFSLLALKISLYN